MAYNRTVSETISVQSLLVILFSLACRMWTGTVRGGWITGLGLSTNWMWYLSPGNLPILSKQSLKSC